MEMFSLFTSKSQYLSKYNEFYYFLNSAIQIEWSGVNFIKIKILTLAGLSYFVGRLNIGPMGRSIIFSTFLFTSEKMKIRQLKLQNI